MHIRVSKIFLFFCIGFVALSIISHTWHIFLDKEFASERSCLPVPNQGTKGKLTIGIIGDSWAAGGENSILPKQLELELNKRGIHAKVVMYGHPGAKSKRIYEDLFEDLDKEHSSKKIFFDSPKYCFILAGVNDFCLEMGGEYYSHHINLIASALSQHEITPFVLELPQLGLANYDALQHKDGLKNQIRQFRNWLRGGGRNREDYIFALKSTFGKTHNHANGGGYNPFLRCCRKF